MLQGMALVTGQWTVLGLTSLTPGPCVSLVRVLVGTAVVKVPVTGRLQRTVV